jgi:hypothetical protein
VDFYFSKNALVQILGAALGLHFVAPAAYFNAVMCHLLFTFTLFEI